MRVRTRFFSYLFAFGRARGWLMICMGAWDGMCRRRAWLGLAWRGMGEGFLRSA